MSRARTRRRRNRKSATLILPDNELCTLEVIERRLWRANDVLNCLNELSHLSRSEIAYGALAIAVQDIIIKVLDDLCYFGRLKPENIDGEE